MKNWAIALLLGITACHGHMDEVETTPATNPIADRPIPATIESAEDLVAIPVLEAADHYEERTITKIAFGSCGHEDDPQPILDVANSYDADLFVFLGDNIYGDTKDMSELQAKYDKLRAKPGFQKLWDSTTVLATWDDHDYGWNDAGKEYPFKNESAQIFLNFWEEPANSARWKRTGIYTSYVFESEGKTVQLILLDNRTFRDPLDRFKGQVRKAGEYNYDMDYWPTKDTTKTFLGEEQWRWLEEQLKWPADLRIIGSGTQFSIQWNGYEAWANMPHERERMKRLIRKTRAEGVVFITGDVHYAEVSKLPNEGAYPIYDFTSSGITSTWPFATPNKNRIKGPIHENHFGLIEIDWESRKLIHSTIDVSNKERTRLELNLSELQFK